MSTRIYPVTFVWRDVDVIDARTGEARHDMAMVPLNAANASQARRQFHDGEEYPLAPLEARSRASHNAYFAELHSYWQNLPETVAARWLNEDHFRKWLLVETGWYDESEIDCATPAHAKETTGLIRSFDVYARMSVHGKKIIIRRARSQSAAAMGKAEFEKSKHDVLAVAATFVGVSPSQMKREVRRR